MATGAGAEAALSVVQCVAKRRRQLERLEFLLSATAQRVAEGSSRHRHSAARKCPLSETAQRERCCSLLQLLLVALTEEQEKQPGVQAFFASALVLEVSK